MSTFIKKATEALTTMNKGKVPDQKITDIMYDMLLLYSSEYQSLLKVTGDYRHSQAMNNLNRALSISIVPDLRARSLKFRGRRGRSLEADLATCCKEHTEVCDWKQGVKGAQGCDPYGLEILRNAL